MNMKSLITITLVVLGFTSCSIIKPPNPDELLKLVSFEVSQLEIQELEFRTRFFFGDKNSLGITDSASLLFNRIEEIKAERFEVDYTQFKLKALIEINNPTEYRIQTDSILLTGEIYQGKDAFPVTLVKSINVAPKSKQLSELLIPLPLGLEPHELIDENSLRLDGNAWTKIFLT